MRNHYIPGTGKIDDFRQDQVSCLDMAAAMISDMKLRPSVLWRRERLRLGIITPREMSKSRFLGVTSTDETLSALLRSSRIRQKTFT
jgi:hypothetical protein